MEIWKDNTSYSQTDKERIPRVWVFKIDGIGELIVHKYVGYGEEWLITCRQIGIEMKESKTTDADEAKSKALSMAYSRLNALANEYKRAALSIEGLV